MQDDGPTPLDSSEPCLHGVSTPTSKQPECTTARLERVWDLFASLAPTHGHGLAGGRMVLACFDHAV